jgi:hypothetical protein
MLIARWVLGNHADCRLTDYFFANPAIHNLTRESRYALSCDLLGSADWASSWRIPGSPGVLFQRVFEILGFGAHVGL